jgi:putative nucleotidyltransferase with HDIG domain
VKEDPPQSKTGERRERRGRPTRKLSFPSRVRDSFRRGADRFLGADPLWSMAFVLVTMVLLGSQRCGVSYPRYVVGDVAAEDIRVKYDIDLPDDAETLARQGEARETVPDVYVHDRERVRRLTASLALLFEEGRALRTAVPGDPAVAPDILAPLAERYGADGIAVLARHDFSSTLQETVERVLQQGMQGKVIGNKALLPRDAEVLVLHVPGGREERLSDYGAVVDLDEARRRARDAAAKLSELTEDERQAIGELVASKFVDANLALDPARTDERRRQAADAVSPVMERVSKGTLLVREGEKVGPDALARLESARHASSGRLGLLDLAGLALIVCMIGFFLWRYASYHQRRFKKIRHLHALLVLMLLGTLLFAQALLWLAGEVVDRFGPPFNEVRHYDYLVPLGAGAIMIALLANGRIAMVYAAFAALLYGAMNGWDARLMTWSLLVQWAAVYAISTYRERAALLRAGLVVGGAGALTTLALQAMIGSLDPLAGSLYAAGLAFVGGAVGVGVVVSFTLPLLEGLFRVLTDVRLLELSNLSNPLLSELAVKAPGSYNHSLVVGTLAEEAAKAIGANSLFCRVAAFYHDIGKLLKPDYYVENQRGTNPHDNLSPSMSALVVAAHVKDGIKLAREAGLPEQIVDIIPQHHGTRLMKYFYEKAKQNADPGMGPIKEEDFRYPGPKPQTREAAIFMLADAVEAAARTVDDPNANRLREMIRKVSNAVVLEGQFQECDLTFVDLDRIHQAFLRTLTSMYHHRVDYPGFDFNKPMRKDNRESEGGGRQGGEPRVARGTS